MKTPPTSQNDPQHVSHILPEVIADLERRVTVNDHQKFRQSLAPVEDDDDLDDDPIADVILDRIPQRRPMGAVARLDRIFDQLERENPNRRSAP
jgi:hypothetical protein